MARRANQKGHCWLCMPHKHKNNGDAERMPWRYRRQLGKKRRLNRNDVD